MDYFEYSSLVDTVLALGLALTVWVAYRELRRRKQQAEDQSSHLSNSPAA